jgi:hypothetical protein
MRRKVRGCYQDEPRVEPESAGHMQAFARRLLRGKEAFDWLDLNLSSITRRLQMPDMQHEPTHKQVQDCNGQAKRSGSRKFAPEIHR